MIEKDKYGSSQLKSLLEFKGVKAGDNIQKYYMAGKFGAIPDIGNIALEVGE